MINKKIFLVSLIIFGLITSCFSFVANSDCIDCDDIDNSFRGLTWDLVDYGSYCHLNAYQEPVNYLTDIGYMPIDRTFKYYDGDEYSFYNEEGLYSVYIKDNPFDNDFITVYINDEIITSFGYSFCGVLNGDFIEYSFDFPSILVTLNDGIITFGNHLLGINIEWFYGNTGLREKITLSETFGSCLKLVDVSQESIFMFGLDFSVGADSDKFIIEQGICFEDESYAFGDILEQYFIDDIFYYGFSTQDLLELNYPVVFDPIQNYYVGCGTDDCCERSDGSLYLSNTAVYFGLEGGLKYNASFRFDDLPIPQYSIINSARFGWYYFPDWSMFPGKKIIVNISGILEYDTPTFSIGNPPSSRPITINHTDWIIGVPPGIPPNPVYQTTPYFNDTLQELVNQSGYGIYNALAFTVLENGSDNGFSWSVMAYEHSTYNPCKLMVNFTKPPNTLTEISDFYPPHNSTNIFPIPVEHSAYFFDNEGDNIDITWYSNASLGRTYYYLSPENTVQSQWTRSGCAENHECVDDFPIHDGHSTKNSQRNNNNNWYSDYFNFTSNLTWTYEIHDVTVYCYVARSSIAGFPSYQNGFELGVKPDNVWNWSDNIGITGFWRFPTYYYRSWSWSTNPDSDTNWTWSEILNMQFGYRGKGNMGTKFITQLVVQIDYTGYVWLPFAYHNNVTTPDYYYAINHNVTEYNHDYWWYIEVVDEGGTNTSSIHKYTTADLDDIDVFLMGVLELSPETFLLLIWMFLFYLWFKSESESMTYLLAIIFIPYTIFFVVHVVPVFEVDWIFSLIFIFIAIIVGGYSIDMERKRRKK